MTVTAPAPAAAPKKKRGRESVGDMVRSMGIVMVIVVVAFVLAQPPKSDDQTFRPVDPTATVADYARTTPGVPVPGPAPAGFAANSVSTTGGVLRVGYVSGKDTYVEYAAGVGPDFLRDQTGGGAPVGTVAVGGTAYQDYRGAGGVESLVRSVAGHNVVVGGVREQATLEQLQQVAAVLR